MKRTIAMVLVLLMAFTLVPLVGMQNAQADDPTQTCIRITGQPEKRYYLQNETLLLGSAFEVTYYVCVDRLVTSQQVVTSGVTLSLNDTNRTVAQGSKLEKTGEFRLTASYKVGNNTYQAQTTIRVRAQKITGLSKLHGLNNTTYFVGETLSTNGLSYQLDKLSAGGIASTSAIDLKDLQLSAGDGPVMSVDDLNRLQLNAAVTDAKIKAVYTDEDQYSKTFTNEDVKYSVLAAPTAVSLLGASGSDISSTTLSWDETYIGNEYAWKASVTLAGGTAVTDKPEYVTWGSSNTNVATISSEGVLKIVGIGETTITIRSRGFNQKTATCVIKVKKAGPDLTDVRLNKSQITLTTGGIDKLIATLVPENAVYQETDLTGSGAAQAPKWSITSTPAGAVEITQDPNNPFAVSVKAKKEGTATISFTAWSTASTLASYTASCTVTVNDVDVSQVYITPTTLTLTEGASYQLQGTALPPEATNKTLTWTSANESLATVRDGLVSIGTPDGKPINWENIIKSGNTKWTAADVKAGKCSTTVKISCYAASNPEVPAAECTITIKQGTPVTQLSLNKYAASVNVGGSTQVTATLIPTNATNKSIVWKSSDPSIATVSSTGKITGIKPGSCTVTATCLGGVSTNSTTGSRTPLTRECSVIVRTVSSGSIGLSALELKLYHGQTATLVATLIPSNTTNKDVTFTSSNPAVAIVDAANGLITAINDGKTTITVTANDGSGATATCLVTVMDKVAVKKVKLNVSDLSLLINDTTVLEATVEPDYASETEVTWTSSNPNAVSVDENGKVSGLIVGQTATITATAKDGSGQYATAEVIVVSTFYGNGKVVNCVRRVNVRAQPSGQATFKGYAYLNETYKVLGKTGNWYKIRYKNASCYIWAPYIRLVGDGVADYTSTGRATAPAPGTGTGTSTGTPTKCTITNCVYAVNVRSGPGTNYDKIGIAAVNTSYTYIGTYGDWYKLKYNATTDAYIHSNYILLS